MIGDRGWLVRPAAGLVRDASLQLLQLDGLNLTSLPALPAVVRAERPAGRGLFPARCQQTGRRHRPDVHHFLRAPCTGSRVPTSASAARSQPPRRDGACCREQQPSRKVMICSSVAPLTAAAMKSAAVAFRAGSAASLRCFEVH